MIIKVKTCEFDGITTKLILSDEDGKMHLTHKVVMPCDYIQRVYEIGGEQREIDALLQVINTVVNGCDIRDVVSEFRHVLTPIESMIG